VRVGALKPPEIAAIADRHARDEKRHWLWRLAAAATGGLLLPLGRWCGRLLGVRDGNGRAEGQHGSGSTRRSKPCHGILLRRPPDEWGGGVIVLETAPGGGGQSSANTIELLRPS
jgi:hypothetical protein